MKKGLTTVIAMGGFFGIASIANAQEAATTFDRPPTLASTIPPVRWRDYLPRSWASQATFI